MVDVGEHGGGNARGSCEDDGVETFRAAWSNELPSVRLLRELADWRGGAQALRIEVRHDGVNHLLHAAFERTEERLGRVSLSLAHLCKFLASGEHGAAERAVALLHLNKFGQHGAHAERSSIAAVDAGE